MKIAECLNLLLHSAFLYVKMRSNKRKVIIMTTFAFKCGNIKLTATPETFSYTVTLENGDKWTMKKTPSIRYTDGTAEPFPAPAECKRIGSGTGFAFAVTYRGFSDPALVAVSVIRLNKQSGELSFSLDITGDRPDRIDRVYYPAPFEFKAKKGEGFTVLPRMQGLLIPVGTPITVANGNVFERDAYMPFFGQIKKGSGYTAIFDTPYDASYEPQKNDIAPVWRTSLCGFSYPRNMIYRFDCPCDHNVIAKNYRAYKIERGELITLKEKEQRNPNVKKLIGLPVIHTHIAVHIAKESMFYDPGDPSHNDHHVSFYERAEQLRRLKKLGLAHAYTHFDGWGLHGYDNLHPSPFPPHQAAGGAEGMKRLADVCKKIGYIFGIHDQYRDYYYDNPDFDLDEGVIYKDGSRPFHTVWNGGAHTFLCSELAPGYVNRNYDKFKELGIDIAASYLDVFSVVELDECHNPLHRTTRERCAYNRRRCLDILTKRGIIPSSEEVLDCILPSQVLCHHAPFYTKELGAYDSYTEGVPIPLLELVYHDCIVVPWIGLPDERGGWGIPKTDSAYVYALLYGCPVYCPIDADEADIDNVKYACSAAKKLAYEELVKHEFIDGDYRRQRTTFSDGTVVEADLDSGEVRIK